MLAFSWFSPFLPESTLDKLRWSGGSWCILQLISSSANGIMEDSKGGLNKEGMMDQIVLELQTRDVIGKAVKRLRQQGMVPAVIHNHGKDSIVVMGEYQTLNRALQKAGRHNPLSLEAGGKQYLALIKNATFDPKKNMLTHVVFNAIKANETVDAEVPVRMRLNAENESTPAERAGLIVLTQLEAVVVEALPKDLPSALEFDGEKLIEVGDQATVADLIVPKGVIIKADTAQPLATVFEPSALQAANDATGGAAEEGAETEVPATEGGEEPESSAEAKEKKE